MRQIVLAFLVWSVCCSKAMAQEKPILLKGIHYINVVSGKGQKSRCVAGGRSHSKNRIAKYTLQKQLQIDGSGKWLIPGLVDAHIHLFQSGGIYTRPDIVDLREFKPYREERKWLVQNATGLIATVFKTRHYLGGGYGRSFFKL